MFFQGGVYSGYLESVQGELLLPISLLSLLTVTTFDVTLKNIKFTVASVSEKADRNKQLFKNK